MPRRLPAAVLWDFDGTLVDTEPLWADIQADMLAEHGVVWSEEEVVAQVGVASEVTAAAMAASIGAQHRAGALLDELEGRVVDQLGAGLPWLPGVADVLAGAHADGVPSAIVTASSRRIMAQAMRHLPDNVEFVISGDDVARPKPDPEGYRKAMARLGVEPSETLVVEDSVTGTTAALASGALVYAVPSVATLEPHPRLRVGSHGPAGLTWAALVAFWNESTT